MRTFLLILGVVGCFWSLPTSASAFDTKGIAKMFDRMDDALKQRKESLFRAQWHPRGYQKNLVGGSGIPGRGVFAQGVRKGWYLKPIMKSAKAIGQKGGVLITVLIWSRRRKRAVDKVYAYVIPHKKQWIILGAGERLREVVTLAKTKAKARSGMGTKSVKRTSLIGRWRGVAQEDNGKRNRIKIGVFYTFLAGGIMKAKMVIGKRKPRLHKGTWRIKGNTLVLGLKRPIAMPFVRKGDSLVLTVPGKNRRLFLVRIK